MLMARIQAAMQSSIGVVRERNEDAAYVDAGLRFFIVADGMGGRSGGELASSLAVTAARAALDQSVDELAGRDAVRGALERAVRAANAAVLERSHADPDHQGMGTTLDVVVVVDDDAFVAHVGDGRTYLVRDGVARQATVDHTIAQVMQRLGTMTQREADRSPMRSVLCNAIGVVPDIAIDHVCLRLQPGDRLLVCTDGLYDYFDDGELGRRVALAPRETALSGLIQTACARGGRDNLTGILIEVGPPAAAPVDDLDDVDTTPIAVPAYPNPQRLLGGVADDALSAFVDHSLRESVVAHPTTVSTRGHRAG